jgi:D-3-phosphoglycerate dehydrogenase
MKVLVTDGLAEEGLALLRQAAEVDVRSGLTPPQLLETIGEYDALVVRSATKVTAEVIAAGEKLRVIARAGTGVDNIDVEAATRRGILVVNAPGGNTVAVAEHTLGLMLALARHIPQADSALRAGRWEKRHLEGVQLYNKTLGLIGLGRVGTAVATRAQALGMKVIAYDPFVSVDQAQRLNVRLCSLETLLAEADCVSIHAALTDHTRNLISREKLALMRPTAYLINCARGGIVDEEALSEALAQGSLAGAALDVFAREPLSADHPLLASPRVVITPHLGASTKEAQSQVSLDIAEQVIAILQGGMARYPVNAPALSAETLGRLGPYIDLASRLGSFYAQMAEASLHGVTLIYSGEIAEGETSPLSSATLMGLLAAISYEPVNLINALVIARERGLVVVEERRPTPQDFANAITLQVETAQGTRQVMGTLKRGEPHIVGINGYWLDFIARGDLLVTEHIEGPGVLGRVGTVLGDAGVNIAFVQVGRRERGGPGVMVLGLDDPVPPETLAQLQALPSLRSARFVCLPR